MDAKKFREIEELYKDLKERQAAGEVSADDMKSELKKMMIRDEDEPLLDDGRQDGELVRLRRQRLEPRRPLRARGDAAGPAAGGGVAREKPRPATASRSGRSEEKPEILCRFCQSRMDEHDAYCSSAAPARRRRPRSRSGACAGDEIQVQCGAHPFAGLFLRRPRPGRRRRSSAPRSASSRSSATAIYQFPMMLQEMRGKFLGGLFFGAIGGIAGFIRLRRRRPAARAALQRPGLRLQRPALQDQVLTPRRPAGRQRGPG